MIIISKAAKILGVSKKTLIRWDSTGKFPSKREPLSGIRFYAEKDVEDHAIWFKLRRKHRAHNRKLKVIRSQVDQYTVSQPLGPFTKPRFHKIKDMKKAYDALHKWEQDDRYPLKCTLSLYN